MCGKQMKCVRNSRAALLNEREERVYTHSAEEKKRVYVSSWMREKGSSLRLCLIPRKTETMSLRFQSEIRTRKKKKARRRA